jgi:biopolymer transport protein ExbD
VRADGFYPSKKTANRQNKFLSELNLWPFAGVVITLLITFMVVTGGTNVCTRSIGPDLAVVNHAALLRLANREDAMRLSVTRDGRFFFLDYRVEPEDLAGRIREAVSNGSEKRVYMIVDARAKYGDVKSALDAVRGAKLENVSFLVNIIR